MQYAKVIPLSTRRNPNRPKPKAFTSHESLIDEVREIILTSGIPYRMIAADCGLSPATIQRIASGQTKWPKASTLFPLLGRLGYELALQEIRRP